MQPLYLDSDGRYVAINGTWFDYIIGNTSTSTIETSENITINSVLLSGVNSELIYKGVTYKRFDLNDDSQSYILTMTNTVLAKRF